MRQIVNQEKDVLEVRRNSRLGGPQIGLTADHSSQCGQRLRIERVEECQPTRGNGSPAASRITRKLGTPEDRAHMASCTHLLRMGPIWMTSSEGLYFEIGGGGKR